MVVDDPSIAFTLNLSRYKDNFSFDPIEAANTETITIIEKIEESPIVRYCEFLLNYIGDFVSKTA